MKKLVTKADIILEWKELRRKTILGSLEINYAHGWDQPTIRNKAKRLRIRLGWEFVKIGFGMMLPTWPDGNTSDDVD